MGRDDHSVCIGSAAGRFIVGMAASDQSDGSQARACSLRHCCWRGSVDVGAGPNPWALPLSMDTKGSKHDHTVRWRMPRFPGIGMSDAQRAVADDLAAGPRKGLRARSLPCFGARTDVAAAEGGGPGFKAPFRRAFRVRSLFLSRQ